MPSVPETVSEIVATDPTLHVGLNHGLLNLSQVARFIHPLVVARLKRDVSVSSILMTLSRLQRGLAKEMTDEVESGRPAVDRISAQAGLVVLSYAKTPDSHKSVQSILGQMIDKDAYITISEGVREIALIVDEGSLSHIAPPSPITPIKVVRNVAGLSIHIAEHAIDQPRVIYQVLQQVALQNISVVEMTSTRSEFHLYLSDSDIMLAFDSIYSKFASKVNPAFLEPGRQTSVAIRR